MSRRLIAGIETGGTKLLARICDEASGEALAEDRWATTSPEAAAGDLADFLSSNSAAGELVAIGIAAFGPLIIDPASPDYGQMQSTTKPGWTGSNLRTELSERLRVPVCIDSDVNAAAIAEQAIGAGSGLANVAYVTVGTGIGAGLAIDGQSLKGAMHPEAGHLQVRRQPGDEMRSVCTFHSNCVEGLASGPAIRKRLGEGRDLGEQPEIVELVATYLGQLGAALVLSWSPHRIVWGGGIINATPLVHLIEDKLRAALGGYGAGPALEKPGFCAQAQLQNAGLEGSLLLARRLVEQAIKKAP